MYRGGVPPLPKPSVVVTNSRSFNNNGSPLRLYHVWKGSNKFFCGGRLVFGPDFRSLYLTIALIVCPVILFCAFVAPRLVHYFPHHQGYAIVILCASFTVYLIVLVIITSGSDPGIIPRNLQPPEPEDDIYSTSTDWTSQVGLPYLPPTKEVPVNGMIIRVKYCQTCMLYRPPRCSHCSICNNCVERFDHHCPWVGQCIGKRNYRFFFMFVSSTSLLCVYVFAFCCVNIKFISKAYNCSMWRAVSKSPISGVLIIYTFVASWFVGGLTAFHFYLICTNQTTYENFRYRYDRKRNPYNLGCPRNLKEILFSKIPVSKNNFPAKVTGNLSSILSTSSSAETMSPEMQKAIFDANTGKRQAVDAEEIDDIQSRIGSMRGLDRCGTQTRPNIIWEENSETETSSMHTIPANFRFEHHELQ